jgi:hypothetical protein
MPSIINATTTTGVTINGDNSGNLAIQTNNGNTAVTIDTSQNVGIGTTTPTAISGFKTLEVKGTATNSGGIFKSTSGNGTNSVLFYTGSGEAYMYTDQAIPLVFYTTGSERFRIASSGETTFTSNTTFSAANFSGKLGAASGYGYWSNSDVSSYIQINGSSNAVPYRVYVTAQSGGVYMAANGTSWTANSDARLKNITGTFTNALADVLQIEAVKFTWKSDAENRPCVGLIAQSVEKVLPEAVSKGALNNSEDKTEYLGVQYTEVIPLLVAAIQELNAKVDAQALEIQALKGVA